MPRILLQTILRFHDRRSPGRPGLAFAARAPMCSLLFAVILSTPTAIAQEATPAVSESVAASSLAAASAWLRERQDPSGGFAGFTSDLDPGVTTDAVLALYAARESDAGATAALDAAITFLDTHGAVYAAAGPGQAAKLVLAAVAGGRDPHAFAGVDLVAAMTAPPATAVPNGVAGSYGDDLYDHALVLLALAAAGIPAPDAAIDVLRTTQAENGGWAFDGSSDPVNLDSNTTALVIQALVAHGSGGDPLVASGIGFLRSLLAPEGGFAYGPADPLVADANSTALVVQALIAAGEDPRAREWGNALLALARFQGADGGFRYLAGDEDANLLATLQAIPALARAPLPVATACPAEDTAGAGECIPLAA